MGSGDELEPGDVPYSQIAYEVADGVATITLDRPDRLNAFTVTMQQELCAAVDEVDADPEVRAVIVTGRGRGFCAGADLGGGEASFDHGSELAADAGLVLEADGRHRDEGGLVALRFFECTKPVIGAINGPAVGVGITMALPFDVRLASTASKFGFVFARRGLVPEACSSWFLPRLVGISRAMEWCATGRVFGPDEALAGGLVRSIHDGRPPRRLRPHRRPGPRRRRAGGRDELPGEAAIVLPQPRPRRSPTGVPLVAGREVLSAP
jgi:enoyl-CoA hydratase/carnithine racemase